jgi:hypothetical protein
MWPHFLHLFVRTIHGMPVLVSSNWASWGLGLAVFFLYELFALAFRGWRDMVDRWKQNVGIGILATIGGYVLLFAYSAVITTYDEHHDGTGRWQAVVNEKNKLKDELTEKDKYVKRLEAKSCPARLARNSIRPQRPQVPVATSETIYDVLAEVRTTCVLKDSSKMPEDIIAHSPGGDSYLESSIGKAYLISSQFIKYQRSEQTGKAIAIEHFLPPENSDLIGRPRLDAC